jgi:hypothetical protein
MDGSRFDRITRNLASGTSRRSLIKTAIGSIAAAAVASRLGSDADAARRTATGPTPTPIPVKCPGQQIPCGSSCCCPSGSDKCESECCPTGQAVCCDGACCYGQCMGEEICCPSNSIVCNGVCLEPGQCCADSDCPSGQMCTNNQCVNNCLPNDASGCNANIACCSGICQGGQCYATVAGNCSTAVAPCADPQTSCGQSPNDGCMCVIVADQTICAAAATCAPDCDHCQHGDICHPETFCCSLGVQCVTPCGPFGGSY